MKLSEQLQKVYDDTPLDVSASAAFDALLVCIELAESYEAEQEKRVAQLEVDVAFNRHWFEQARSHLGRIHELEAQNVALTCDMNAFRLRCETLQSQLAWKPVSAGLPTEPGWYEVASTRKQAVDVFRLTQLADGLWWFLRDVRYESPLERYPSADIYRRIELPEAP